MDENFYYFLLAIPATCAFWFLYMIVVTELAKWSARRRIQARKSEPSPVSIAPVEFSQQENKHLKAIRGFDSPDLFRAEILKRIRQLEKRMAERNWVEH
ncbi:MAG: hypothetical protein WCH75_14330 [Candidatus Binatia bacterium]